MQECMVTRMSIVLSSAAVGTMAGLRSGVDPVAVEMLLSKADSNVAQQSQAWKELAENFARISQLSVHTILTLVFSDIESAPPHQTAQNRSLRAGSWHMS